jgi:hypothetical protein
MKVTTAKAAILTESRKPLVVVDDRLFCVLSNSPPPSRVTNGYEIRRRYGRLIL